MEKTFIVCSHKDRFETKYELVTEEEKNIFLEKHNAKMCELGSLAEGTDVYRSTTNGRTYIFKIYNGGDLSGLNFAKCQNTTKEEDISPTDKLNALIDALKSNL